MAAWNIIEGDCTATLPTLPERHFHTCVTSPPTS
jgi:DNA modification methylase